MDVYNPEKNINPTTWLALDETERLELIEHYVYSDEEGIDDNVASIHSTAHCIVENQLALDVKETVDAYKRLIRQGLKRHDTIHALAAVIFEGVNESMSEVREGEVAPDMTIRYKSRLRKLTAKRWLKGKY